MTFSLHSFFFLLCETGPQSRGRATWRLIQELVVVLSAAVGPGPAGWTDAVFNGAPIVCEIRKAAVK